MITNKNINTGKIEITGSDDVRLSRFLEWAILRSKPVSITYLKQAKGPSGRPLWDDREGVRKPVLESTIRTVEPWTIEKRGTSDAYVRGMDRRTGQPRSWRLDRIQEITYHQRGRQVVPAYVGMTNIKKA
jgi:hypothetical protein